MDRIMYADVSASAASGQVSARVIAWVPGLMSRIAIASFLLGILAQAVSMTAAHIFLAITVLSTVVGAGLVALTWRRSTRHYRDLAEDLGLSRLPTLDDLGNGYLTGTSWTTGSPTTVVVDDERTHGWAFPARCDSLPGSEGETCPSSQS